MTLASTQPPSRASYAAPTASLRLLHKPKRKLTTCLMFKKTMVITGKNLEAITRDYKPPDGSKRNKENNTSTDNSSNSTNDTRGSTSIDEAAPFSLFEVLPFHEPPEDDVQLRPFACIPFIPSISHQPLAKLAAQYARQLSPFLTENSKPGLNPVFCCI
jgi:hypothetical protein